MAEKTLTLKLAGLWPSPNDYTTREGALDVADNIVIDQTDLGESRRGFEIEIDNSSSALDGYLGKSMTSPNPNEDTIDLLTYRLNSGAIDGKLLINDEDSITGDASFLPPPGAKACRMLNWGKYIYVASNLGIKRYSAALNSSVAAGVPQALDIAPTLSGSSGFFDPNEVADITATRTNASATLTTISDADIAEAAIGQTLSGTGITTGTVISDITLSEPVVIHSCGLTAGNTTITSAGNGSIAAGQLVSGEGIPVDTRVVSISGGGPYSVVLTKAAIFTDAAVSITFSSDNEILMSANATSGAPTVTTVTLSNGSQVAYRLVWGFRNENDAVSIGAPSGFAILPNNTGGFADVSVVAAIPEGITEDYFYQLYRSPITPTVNVTPPDQEQLVVEGFPSAMDIAAGYVTISDQTPDSLKGEALYTGTDVEGISQANYPPPVAADICTFRGYTLYANYTLPYQLKLTMDGIGSPNGIQTGDVITVDDGTSPFDLTADSSEDIAAGEFKIFSTGTPAQNIADTCASFIRVMNRYSANTTVYAYLLSGPNDLPGQMLIQSRVNIGVFDVVASAHGTAWTPNIDTAQTAIADSSKNGILISKTQQPEAVPRVNLFRAGGLENEIIRVVPLRDYTIVLTSGGVFRLTGQTLTDFVLEPFDLTVICVAPETAVALGNECWTLTLQGAVSISDGGVRMRSGLQLNQTLLNLVRSAPQSVEDVAFAVAYESDQRYILGLPAAEGDTFCSQEYCYNYIMDRWTRWTRDCTAGYVNTKKGLYLFNGSNNNVVKERKSGTYADYVDESFETEIVSVDGFDVTLTSVSEITVGDLLWQDQTTDIFFSEVVDIDVPTNTVTVANELPWTTGSGDETLIYAAIECTIQWKPNAAGDPSEAKQYSEGQLIFRQPRFLNVDLAFATDISSGFEPVPDIEGSIGGLGWGGSGWGTQPWGGSVRPKTNRFYIPANKQYAGVLITKMTIRSAYANFQLEGIEIIANDIGFELGGPGG